MRWTNPGHQLDTLGARYINVKYLYIYGTDEVARKAYDFLRWLHIDDKFEIFFVLDDSIINLNPAEFCGRPVIPFSAEVCARLKDMQELSAILLPNISKTNERTILENLNIANVFYLSVSHNRRDNFIQNFLCIWLMYSQEKLLSHTTNYIVTSRCNLNCKYCLNFNDLINTHQDIPFEEFKNHIDIIFNKFDYFYSFHLTGGEPLICKDLEKKINYIAENYKEKIYDFFVITNGTLRPSDEVIAALHKIGGWFLIDDYSATCRQSKINTLKDVLCAHNIPYTVNKVSAWYDLEAGRQRCITDHSELENHKDACNSYLHEFADGKIFACCYQKYAERAGLAKISDDEFISIQDMPKMEILEFRQGYTKKGYVDFCKYCRGIGDCAKLVMPAVQLPHNPIMNMEQEQIPSVPGLVSICVPVHNTAPYLRRCIDSLLCQTYSHIEIILADDGSNDGSGDICDAYAAKESRIRVIHKQQGGEASARNAALASAHGQYIMFIDSDDEYLPHAVQSLVDAAANSSSELIIGSYIERHEDVEFFSCCHRRHYTADGFVHSYILDACPNGIQYLATTVNAKLFQRDIITQNNISFDTRFVIGNDAVFMCEYLKHTSKIYSNFEPIYIYYKYKIEERVQGMSWNYPDAFFLYVYIIDKIINISSIDVDTYKNIIINQYKNFIYGLINSILSIHSICTNMQRRMLFYCANIDLLYPASKIFMDTDIPQDRDIPLCLISFLIIEKKYDTLVDVIELCAYLRDLTPNIQSNSRLMIRLDNDGHSLNEATLSNQDIIRKNDDVYCQCNTKNTKSLFNKLSKIYNDAIANCTKNDNIAQIINKERNILERNFNISNNECSIEPSDEHISKRSNESTLLHRGLKYYKNHGIIATIQKIFSKI